MELAVWSGQFEVGSLELAVGSLEWAVWSGQFGVGSLELAVQSWQFRVGKAIVSWESNCKLGER